MLVRIVLVVLLVVALGWTLTQGLLRVNGPLAGLDGAPLTDPKPWLRAAAGLLAALVVVVLSLAWQGRRGE